MRQYAQVKNNLSTSSQKRWLITGVAGFIGSNLLETLLTCNQDVKGLDNFSTGHQHNLDQVQELVTKEQWARFSFTKGDIRNEEDCQEACQNVDYVLHQAALGSVPRSLENPQLTNANNLTGYLNMLVAARDQKVKKFVYAASSSTYGDHPGLPKVEDKIGKPLSPYAVTKYVNELYADVFNRCYEINPVGLRYFNIFGRRQDPNGAYAAVMPKWIGQILNGEDVYINGDGETSRDFTYIENVVQANILAGTTSNKKAFGEAFNIAIGGRETLNNLYDAISKGIQENLPNLNIANPIYRDFRAGDIRHSNANITKMKELLKYEPTHTLENGLRESIVWYIKDSKKRKESVK